MDLNQGTGMLDVIPEFNASRDHWEDWMGEPGVTLPTANAHYRPFSFRIIASVA